MPIEKSTLINCPDCKNDFRWVPTSTIKPKRCPRCQNLSDFQRKQSSADKIAENKKLLKNAGFYGKKEKKQKQVIKRGKDPIANLVAKGKNSLMKYADAMFSRFIRLKFSFESCGEVYCRCYTCNTPIPIKKAQCGHWQRRGFKTTRYDENNARPQCVKCNMYNSGEPEKFELKLIKEIGPEKVAELKQLSQQLGEDNAAFYKEIGDKYKYRYERLCKEKGFKKQW